MQKFNPTIVPPVSLTIPFGYPVVPDVYRIYSGCAEGTGVHSAISLVFEINSS